MCGLSGVSGGFSANLLITPTDATLAAITNEALGSALIDYEMSATGNWYFIIASTFLVTIVGSLVTDKIVEPRLGKYQGDYVFDAEEVSPIENKGLRNAGISILIFAIILGLLMFAGGDNAVFKSVDSSGQVSLTEFLNNGLLLTILIAFSIPGIAYGKTIGTIKGSKEVVYGMSSGVSTMNSYIVLVFLQPSLSIILTILI